MDTSTALKLLFFTLNREDFSFVIHLDRQPRTSRRREAQTGSRARSGSRSERTLDAVEHSRTLMEWWPFLIFHRGGLRIKVINNITTLTPFTTAMALRRLWVVFPLGFLLHRGLRRAFIGRWRPELAPQEITYVSHVFVIACLAHSVLIFFPNHVPPDLWNHLPQVRGRNMSTTLGHSRAAFSEPRLWWGDS